MIFGTLVALVAYQSFYPVCLMVPGILFFMQNDSHNLKAALLKPLLSFLVSLGLLMVVSAEVAGGWEFLEATYGFMWVARDVFVCCSIEDGDCFVILYWLLRWDKRLVWRYLIAVYFNCSLHKDPKNQMTQTPNKNFCTSIFQPGSTRPHAQHRTLLVLLHWDVWALPALFPGDIPNQCLCLCTPLGDTTKEGPSAPGYCIASIHGCLQELSSFGRCGYISIPPAHVEALVPL